MKGKELVILAKTARPAESNWEFRSNSNPLPSHETVADFRARKEQPCGMRGPFDTLRPSRLLPEDEAAAVFKPPDPWGTFYKKFPNATGVITFAQPGYDRSRSEALVAMSHTCGGLCGVGRLYLLNKVNGKWVIKNSVDVWIS